MDFEKVKEQISQALNKTSKDFGNIKTDAKIEGEDVYVAAKILLLFLENKPVTPQQISFLKTESIDFTKVLALIGLQAVPGSSVAIVILQKIALKHGFSLFPSLINNPEQELKS
ncbi:MAG: hypothetical protein ACK5NB_04080 [Flavobacteriaceae bacterium]